ncbi:unnamed protein product [Darwinula stevensoni]|uniref:Uncharacterized protein n=1 Tax=Darwinula stevensoni TaxID=69355 RepID=A0A7R8XAV4_9CRUS|nr:unnamed protein product [Darwinula stevensoni]CAG0892254.1 unnamed protein product [Darwinula stevensoni]
MTRGKEMCWALWGFWITSSVLPYAGGTSCRFPERWQGKWFQSGLREPMVIEEDRISLKGNCIQQSHKDKFLLHDKRENCYRCIVVHEKHKNVLQYKESYCSGPSKMETLCNRITGDTMLFSIFRINPTPIACPVQGHFQFTYSRGHGWCVDPVSQVKACTTDARLLFRFHACPDVPGTESSVEDVECIAQWKEGATRYLVGVVTHSRATSYEDSYRCFVYEESLEPSEEIDFRIAQSGDATCNGLFSAYEGSRTLRLIREKPPGAGCRYPTWLTGGEWRSLDGKTSYGFSSPGRNDTLEVLQADGPIRTELCHRVLQQEEFRFHLVSYVTDGCDSGYACVHYSRRHDEVLQRQISGLSQTPEEACEQSSFFLRDSASVILTPSHPSIRPCPWQGHYSVLGEDPPPLDDPCPQAPSRLSSGCTVEHKFQIMHPCRNPSKYACHGSWREGSRNHVVATPLEPGPNHRVCVVSEEMRRSYSDLHFNQGKGQQGLESPQPTSRFLLLQGSCSSHSQAEIMAFNATYVADCSAISMGQRGVKPLGMGSLVLIIFLILAAFVH